MRLGLSEPQPEIVLMMNAPSASSHEDTGQAWADLAVQRSQLRAEHERQQEVWWQIRTQEMHMRTHWEAQQHHLQAQWSETNAENRDLAHRSNTTGAGI